MKDISGLDGCFSGAIIAESIVNADALLLPAESIGLSCYNNIVSQFDATLTSFGVEVPVENIPDYGCYRMLYNSKKVVNGPKFPKLKSVGNRGLTEAFRGCSSLSSVELLSALNSIGNNGLEFAFQNCSSLTSVELPSTPISVGTYGCRNAFAKSGIKTVENLSLSGIGQYGCQGMFLSCADLEKVDGLSAENLSGDALLSAFAKCSSLTSVQDLHIDNSENANKKTGNARCDSMFDGCKSLLSVGGLIKGLYGQRQLRYMFRNCKSLKDASKLSVEVNYGQ